MMFEINLIDRETTDIGEDYGSFYYNEDQYRGLLNEAIVLCGTRPRRRPMRWC